MNIRKKISAILLAAVVFLMSGISVSAVGGQKLKVSCKAAAVAEMFTLVLEEPIDEEEFYANSQGHCKNLDGKIFRGYNIVYCLDKDPDTTGLNSLKFLINLLEHNIMCGVPTVVEISSLKNNPDSQHWVVVLGKQDDTYLIFDPAKGGYERWIHVSELGAYRGEGKSRHYGFVSLAFPE